MKRFLLCLAVIWMAAFPTLAEVSIPNEAVVLTAQMDRLMEDDAYLQMMIGSSAPTNPIVKLAHTWREGDYSIPRMVVHADTSNLLQKMPELYAAAGVQTLSSKALETLNRKLPMALPSMLIGFAGSEKLAASTACSNSTVFASEAEGSGLFILLYSNGIPAMAAWRGSQGAVQMQTCFMPYDDLSACQTLADVQAWLKEHSFDLPCTLITLP